MWDKLFKINIVCAISHGRFVDFRSFLSHYPNKIVVSTEKCFVVAQSTTWLQCRSCWCASLCSAVFLAFELSYYFCLSSLVSRNMFIIEDTVSSYICWINALNVIPFRNILILIRILRSFDSPIYLKLFPKFTMYLELSEISSVIVKQELKNQNLLYVYCDAFRLIAFS